MPAMRALILTNEFPPHVYGGAGVHVDYLTRELRKLIDVEVRSFAGQPADEGGWRVRAYEPSHDIGAAEPKLKGLWATLSRDIGFVADSVDADVVHCHTWYTHLAGMLARLAYGIPLVITVHSLEPLRPWKREQLGGGYDVSTWIERISIQWPRLMTVIRLASSHQTSTVKNPRVAAQEAMKATRIARLMSVIIPGCRLETSARAPSRKTRPP